MSRQDDEQGDVPSPEDEVEETGTNPSEQGAVEVKHRTRLPTMIHHKLSIWGLLKETIGRDLTRICMPLEIFEPLGVLQVFCEELEYSELLDKATEEADPFRRLAYVASFAVSRYASTVTRAFGKPFNPLEGETYECIRDDLGWRFVAEQVLHHPGISACYAEGKNWKWSQSAHFEMSFWGNSVHAKPKTPVDVTLRKFKETYRWNKVVTTVGNLIFGKRYLVHHGDMFVKCSSRVSCKLRFSKSAKSVTGKIVDSNGKERHTLEGNWFEYLKFDNEKIWRAHPMPSYAEQQYGFGDFQASLNELTDDIKRLLPPTDTRFRPDQRLFEQGKLEEGKVQKLRLEVEQRARRKQRTYQPKWFTDKTPAGEKFKVMVFNQRYWTARANHFAGVDFDNLF